MNTTTLSIYDAMLFVKELANATTAIITENTITVGSHTFEYKKIGEKIEIISSNTNVEPLFFFYNNTAQAAIQRLFTLPNPTTPTPTIEITNFNPSIGEKLVVLVGKEKKKTFNKAIQAFICGNFGTLFVEFTVVKSTDLQPHAVNTLATLNFDLKECYVDISDDDMEMEDRRPATDIPETDTAEKIVAIIWENISEWETSDRLKSIAAHYYRSYIQLKGIKAEITENAYNIACASRERKQRFLNSLTAHSRKLEHSLKAAEKLFKGNESDFNRYFAD